MRCFIFLLILISESCFAIQATHYYSSEKNKTENPLLYNHYSLIGDNAQTVGHLKLNFDKMPGGQINDSFFMNSLTLGLGKRFELGFIPWSHSTRSESLGSEYSLASKFNFYKSQEFQMSLGWSQIKFSGNDNFENHDEDTSILGSTFLQYWMNYYSFSINYTPRGKDYNLGLTFKYTHLKQRVKLNSKINSVSYKDDLNMIIENQFHENTISLDFNKQIFANHWYGLALGTSSLSTRLESNDEEGLYKPRLTTAFSYIYKKRMKYITSPRLSIAFFEGGENSISLGASF